MRGVEGGEDGGGQEWTSGQGVRVEAVPAFAKSHQSMKQHPKCILLLV